MPAPTSALQEATSLAAGPPLALAAAKRLVQEGGALPFAASIDLEREVVSALFDTADRVEGLTAFREKRQPKFEGR